LAKKKRDQALRGEEPLLQWQGAARGPPRRDIAIA